MPRTGIIVTINVLHGKPTFDPDLNAMANYYRTFLKCKKKFTAFLFLLDFFSLDC
jgi:hypothetical protein